MNQEGSKPMIFEPPPGWCLADANNIMTGPSRYFKVNMVSDGGQYASATKPTLTEAFADVLAQIEAIENLSAKTRP